MPAELRYSAPDYFRVESDKVLVGGKPVSVSDEEDGESLIIWLPVDLPLGPATVVLETSAGNSQPFQIVVDAYSPGIFSPSPSPSFTWGLPAFDCSHTAAGGDILYLFAVGLGIPDATGAVAKPVILVGGKTVDVTEFVSAVLPGVGFMGDGAIHRLQFVVPQGDGMRGIAITAGGRKSNAVSLPVGRAMQNLSPPSFRVLAAAAPQSIVSAYQCSGEGFVPGPDVVWGTPPDLPTSLAGVSMTVRDSEGVERLAPLYGSTLAR
jgi:uncharacterized protein (TIGR03437 family)